MPKNYSVESFIKVQLKDPQGEHFATIRVWKHQKNMGPFHLDNVPIWEAIDKFHQMTAREIVEELLKLKGVVKVKWTGRDGCGFVVKLED